MPDGQETFLTALASGAVAGAMADCITHPVDTVRVRLQTHISTGDGVYRGMISTFKDIITRESWKTLYNGFGITIAATIPAHAFYFGGYEVAKKYLSPNTPLEEKGPLVHFTGGLVADIAGSIVWVPQDVIKQRLQVQHAGERQYYKGSWDAVRIIYREEGALGFYKGYWPAIATYGPFVGFYFLFYEQMKRLSVRMSSTKASESDLTTANHLICGASAGALASALTNPMDVVKTRMQVQGKNYEGKKYKNAMDAVRTMLREEKPRVFMSGVTARIWWIAPNTAITIAAYEACKKVFSQYL
eukprot:GFYU01040146.1.p1 GENE.GFYU01040146.1~~GFYU01040146.1.p1  ORF type:complete len:301 (-),score=45.87 GFYU01040146.1:134-1036(-)